VKTWTVVGLVDVASGDASGELLVAGVVEGRHPVSDTTVRTGRYSRYVAFIEAATADQAEARALAEHDGDVLGDVDEQAPEPLWPVLVCAGPDVFAAGTP
jgi:hypothetical protein